MRSGATLVGCSGAGWDDPRNGLYRMMDGCFDVVNRGLFPAVTDTGLACKALFASVVFTLLALIWCEVAVISKLSSHERSRAYVWSKGCSEH